MKVSDIIGKGRIDLNVDIGEGFAFDKDLLAYASSANISCGVHAGSKELTKDTIRLCKEKGIRIGVHPGYPHRESMGRTALTIENEIEYLNSIQDQVKWFSNLQFPAYVKPHGAFYNETALVLPDNWETQIRKQPSSSRYEMGGLYLAQTPGIQLLTMLLRIMKVPLMGLATTAHTVIATRASQMLIREGFADRGYTEKGTLIPRSSPGALLSDPNEIKEQVLRLAPKVDSICLHGDTPDCLVFAEMIYRTLTDAGYEVSHQ